MSLIQKDTSLPLLVRSTTSEVTDNNALQDSWVNVTSPPSRGSTSSITTCTDLLADAQRENGASRHSPKSVQSESGIRRRGKESNMDWILEWSSRPEVECPKWVRWQGIHGDPGVTPPNSPMPEPSETCQRSLRHSEIIKSPLFSAKSIAIIIFTNFLSMLVGAGLGCLFLRWRMQDNYEM